VLSDSLRKSVRAIGQRSESGVFAAEFERVNRCAYFDYQREKVYVRTMQTSSRIPVVKVIPSDTLPSILRLSLDVRFARIVGASDFHRGPITRRVIDLKFYKTG